MKKSLILVLATLLFVVLGCSFAGLGKKDDAPTPAPDTTTSDTKTSDTSKAPETSGDTTTASSGSGNLTLANFVKMKSGMSYEDVKKILGSDGSETSSSTIGKNELKAYKWEGDKFVRVYANFRNDELRSFSQSGLDAPERNVTKAQYDQINTGMSYEEVKKIVGSDGALKSSSGGTANYTSYGWKGPKFARLSVRFKNDQMTNKSQSNLK